MRILLAASCLVFFSCSRLKACGGEVPAAQPAAVAVAPGRDAGAADPFAHKYVVIVATERTEEQLAEAKARLGSLTTTRISSTNYSGLKPCFSLLVASAHATKDQAMAAAAALKPTQSYVRNTREFVGGHPAREELCRVPEKKVASDLWLVTSFGMLLGPSAFDVRLETEDRKTWSAPIKESAIAGVARGDEFRVISADGTSEKTCRVKAFQAVVRGVPHFGYFQQEPPPESPGCGTQDDFAVLDCDVPEDAVAVRASDLKGGVPDAYAPRDHVEGINTDALARELTESSAYGSARQQLRSGGAAGARVTEELSHRFFVGKLGTVVYSELNLAVPLEEEECGLTEITARISRAVLIQPTNHLELLAADRRDDTSPLGFVDFDLDGEVEVVMDESVYSRQRTLHRGGEVIVTDHVQFCDCPC